MIQIEEFLFRENIEDSMSGELILKFPSLKFRTTSEFYDFFESNGVSLQKNSTVDTNNSLLERIKKFKSSSDYASVREYIRIQNEMKAAIQNDGVVSAYPLLESAKSIYVDPFFLFLVRRIVTGSVDGVLPSEEILSFIDKNKISDEIVIDADVNRDVDGTIQSYRNYLKNKGSLMVAMLDDRFLLESFRYVVPSTFTQLDAAVSAEENIIRRANDIDSVFNGGGSFEEILRELIVKDSNTIPALQIKVEELSSQLDSMMEAHESKVDSIGDLMRTIEELSTQRNLLLGQLDAKDITITELNATISSTLEELQEQVLRQLNEGNDAFDSISEKIEQQMKESQEASERQLQAFKDSISGIVDALKPTVTEPEQVDSDGDGVADDVQNENDLNMLRNNIVMLLESIFLIPISKNIEFRTILDRLGIRNKPVSVDYAVNAPSAYSNVDYEKESITRSSRWQGRVRSSVYSLMTQMSKWSEIKEQWITIITDTTDKKILDEVYRLLKEIRSGSNSVFFEVIKDCVYAWSRDLGKTSEDKRAGSGTSFMRSISEDVLKLAWNPASGNNGNFGRWETDNLPVLNGGTVTKIINDSIIADENAKRIVNALPKPSTSTVQKNQSRDEVDSIDKMSEIISLLRRIFE